MFADGKFYLITQTATDFVSDGPWVSMAKLGQESIRMRGKIDQWSKWQDAEETYSIIKASQNRLIVTPQKSPFSICRQAKVSG